MSKSKRGFAGMDPEKHREIASRGGKAAKNRYRFTSDTASEAGRVGGEKVSRDREHMAEIGRRGGKARHSKKES